MIRVFLLGCLTLVASYAPAVADDARLKMDFFAWEKPTTQPTAKMTFFSRMPSHAKPAVSVTVAATVGKESETKVRMGDETYTIIARVSKITEKGVDADISVSHVQIYRDRAHGIQVGSRFIPGRESQFDGGEVHLVWGKRSPLGGSAARHRDETSRAREKYRVAAITAIPPKKAKEGNANASRPK